jgi:hypothetical protein
VAQREAVIADALLRRGNDNAELIEREFCTLSTAAQPQYIAGTI